MFTKTIVPKTASVTIQLPENFIGEQVRVIATVEKRGAESMGLTEKIRDIKKRYSIYPRVDLGSFTFNRDEANDFD